MRFLSRFGLAALIGFLTSSLIASASFSLGFWLGRNSDNLWSIIYASVPFALALGLVAILQLWRKAGQAGSALVAALIGAALAFFYTLIVVGYAHAIPAFVVLMLSCWVPGGISAMLASVRGKQLSVVIGIAILCVAATFLPEPIFNAVTHNQQLTVALVAPSDASTAQLEANPETLGFDNPNEIQAAKGEVLKGLRALGYTETFRVLSITREGKGKKSLAIVVVKAPITKIAVLPEPDASMVVYFQQSENWEKNPAQTPVLNRGITLIPPDTPDKSLGYFDIPDAQGVSLEGGIGVKASGQP